MFAQGEGDVWEVLDWNTARLQKLLTTSLSLLLGEKIPRGSTIIVFSLTSLAALGQVGYGERVAAEAVRLSYSLASERLLSRRPQLRWGQYDDPPFHDEELL